MKITREHADCGCEFESLTIDGETVMSGDYYHNKITEAIDGFLDGVRYILKVDSLVIEKKEIRCPYCIE